MSFDYQNSNLTAFDSFGNPINYELPDWTDVDAYAKPYNTNAHSSFENDVSQQRMFKRSLPNARQQGAVDGALAAQGDNLYIHRVLRPHRHFDTKYQSAAGGLKMIANPNTENGLWEGSDDEKCFGGTNPPKKKETSTYPTHAPDYATKKDILEIYKSPPTPTLSKINTAISAASLAALLFQNRHNIAQFIRQMRGLDDVGLYPRGHEAFQGQPRRLNDLGLNDGFGNGRNGGGIRESFNKVLDYIKKHSPTMKEIGNIAKVAIPLAITAKGAHGAYTKFQNNKPRLHPVYGEYDFIMPPYPELEKDYVPSKKYRQSPQQSYVSSRMGDDLDYPEFLNSANNRIMDFGSGRSRYPKELKHKIHKKFKKLRLHKDHIAKFDKTFGAGAYDSFVEHLSSDPEMFILPYEQAIEEHEGGGKRRKNRKRLADEKKNIKAIVKDIGQEIEEKLLDKNKDPEVKTKVDEFVKDAEKKTESWFQRHKGKVIGGTVGTLAAAAIVTGLYLKRAAVVDSLNEFDKWMNKDDDRSRDGPDPQDVQDSLDLDEKVEKAADEVITGKRQEIQDALGNFSPNADYDSNKPKPSIFQSFLNFFRPVVESELDKAERLAEEANASELSRRLSLNASEKPSLVGLTSSFSDISDIPITSNELNDEDEEDENEELTQEYQRPQQSLFLSPYGSDPAFAKEKERMDKAALAAREYRKRQKKVAEEAKSKIPLLRSKNPFGKNVLGDGSGKHISHHFNNLVKHVHDNFDITAPAQHRVGGTIWEDIASGLENAAAIIGPIISMAKMVGMGHDFDTAFHTVSHIAGGRSKINEDIHKSVSELLKRHSPHDKRRTHSNLHSKIGSIVKQILESENKFGKHLTPQQLGQKVIESARRKGGADKIDKNDLLVNKPWWHNLKELAALIGPATAAFGLYKAYQANKQDVGRRAAINEMLANPYGNVGFYRDPYSKSKSNGAKKQSKKQSKKHTRSEMNIKLKKKLSGGSGYQGQSLVANAVSNQKLTGDYNKSLSDMGNVESIDLYGMTKPFTNYWN